MRISDWSSDVCFSDLVRYIGWEGDQAAIATLAPGDIAVLENTRFFSGEEKNDPKVVDRLAAIGDFYASDALSDAHRAHASTEDRNSVVSGKRVTVRVDLGGPRTNKNKNKLLYNE